MAFDDLTPYEYDRNNEGGRAVNVGWLGRRAPTVGDTPLEVLDALRAWPVTNRYRGWHTCELCGRNGIYDGNGDLRVPGVDGVVYIAPALITHYIEAHRYQPPQSFIEAVQLAHRKDAKP